MKWVQWTLLGPFFRRHVRRCALLCVVGILSSVSTILLPVSLGKYYALVFDFAGNRSALFDALPAYFYDTVAHFLLFFLGLILINFLANFAKRYLITSSSELLIYELRNRLFLHQLRLETRIYEDKGIGKYLLRYSGDLKSIQNYVSKGIIEFASDILIIALFLIVLGLISPSLALISVLALFLMLIPLSVLNKKLHDVSEKRRNKKSGLLSFVSKRLQAMITIKAFNRESPEKEKFFKRSKDIFQVGLAFHRWSSLIFVMVPALLYLMLALIMYVIHWQQSGGINIDQGTLLSAFLLIMTMLPVFRRSLRVLVVWKLGMISIRKLQSILGLPVEDPDIADELIISDAKLRLSNVSFAFDSVPAFKNISAEWAGQGLHIVTGGTGAGKSTLAKLLLGIYRNYEGEICIDDQEITEVNIKSLRKQIAIVSESYPLLGKTVFEAISYSRKESKRKGAALLLNKIQEGIPEEVRLKLDDPIGNESKHLSQGQERILLFARALLTRKPILVLDEPFDSVESQMISHLIDLIKKLKRKCTIILMLKDYDLYDLDFDSVLDLSESRQNIELHLKSIKS